MRRAQNLPTSTIVSLEYSSPNLVFFVGFRHFGACSSLHIYLDLLNALELLNRKTKQGKQGKQGKHVLYLAQLVNNSQQAVISDIARTCITVIC